ncbi:hypothetical protein FRB97_005557 [Tulasnella sp. 331]|nr:hypothetical protein FRB97_005557 [Tulasnella sp. 331]
MIRIHSSHFNALAAFVHIAFTNTSSSVDQFVGGKHQPINQIVAAIRTKDDKGMLEKVMAQIWSGWEQTVGGTGSEKRNVIFKTDGLVVDANPMPGGDQQWVKEHEADFDAKAAESDERPRDILAIMRARGWQKPNRPTLNRKYNLYIHKAIFSPPAKMTSTASLHFGPEWMRKPSKAAPASPGPNGNPSSPFTTGSNHANSNSNYGPVLNGTPVSTHSSNTGQTHSSYSSLLASPMQPSEPSSDSSNPFRYSKEQMLAVWKNGGGHGELGLEVERWPGIVTEDAGEPLGLTELTPDEKKLYAMPYNSDPPALRRRGDSYSVHAPLLASGGGFDSARDRNKLNSSARGYGVSGVLGNAGGAPMSVGLGLPARRKKDENGADVPLYRPRQLSLGTGMGPASPVSASPVSAFAGNRPRLGGAGFDGVMGDAWGAAGRRRVSEPRVPTLGAKDDKLDAPWRNGGDPRFKDEIMEEPVDDWENEVVAEPGSLKQANDTSMDADAEQQAQSLDPHLASTSNSVLTMENVHPENVQWMYKDPTGQIQGPFMASVMQTWYSSGYFADDLLLQRVELDQDFDPLYDLRQRVISPGTQETLFLSSISSKVPLLPPGLVSGQTSAPPGQQHFTTAPQHLNGSAAPSPGHVSTLMGSSSYHSSPSGSNAAFTTSNTDVNAPSGTTTVRSTLSDLEKQKREREEFLRDLREKELASQAHINASDGSADGTSHINASDGSADGTSHINASDGSADGTSHIIMGAGRGMANGGFGGVDLGIGSSVLPASFLSGQMGFQGNRNDLGYQNDFGISQNHQMQSFNTPSSLTSLGQPSAFSSNHILGFNEGPLHNGRLLGQMYSSAPIHGHPQAQVWPGQQQQGLSNHLGNFAPVAAAPNHSHSHVSTESSPWYSIIEPSNANLPLDHHHQRHASQFQQPSTNQETISFHASSAPWGHHTASQSATSSGPTDQHYGFASEQHPHASPLATTPQPAAEAPSAQLQVTPDVSVSGQRVSDLLQSLNLRDSPSQPPQPADPPAVVPSPVTQQATVEKPTTTSTAQHEPSSAQQQGSGKRRAAAAAAVPAGIIILEKLAPAPFSDHETPAVSTPSSARPVWSNFSGDDKSIVASTVSLRQIQETEAKRAAEQKKVEREKAKAAAATTETPSPQSIVPTSELTGSWGLPQVGRAVQVPAAPSPAPPSTPVAAGNVWSTKPPQASKKTMKEIQEEEERQKKVAAQQAQVREPGPAQIVAAPVAPAKRGYADSAKTSSTTSVSTGVWSTIGAGGKVMAGATGVAPVAATPTTPATPVTRTSGFASLPARPATSNTPQPSPNTAAPRTAAQPSSSSKALEEVPTPSLEFIAWMRQALKGLTSANVEEVMSMLLSFPLDPPPSTMDLISDTIYEYSSILDGRRFATEYVIKRKADAASVKANGSKPPGAIVPGKTTLADVVRTQPPKPAESEWAYKVVTKKKAKGARGHSNN